MTDVYDEEQEILDVKRLIRENLLSNRDEISFRVRVLMQHKQASTDVLPRSDNLDFMEIIERLLLGMEEAFLDKVA